MIHPVAKAFITQLFGANPSSYAKFGFKGHNGLDYRAFNDQGDRVYSEGVSKVYAPHGGKIIENAYDAAGYGNYIKIENDFEGSVLAHLSSRSTALVGTFVDMGQLIGFQGTTGNSTGIHLHWGYYKIPRDRDNGYGGMIDQTPFINEAQGGSMANMYGNPALDLNNIDSMKVVVDRYNELNKALAAHEYLTKAEVDTMVKAEYDRGFKAGKDSVPVVPPSVTPTDQTFDPSMWEENGYQVETTVGNKVITLNYRRK